MVDYEPTLLLRGMIINFINDKRLFVGGQGGLSRWQVRTVQYSTNVGVLGTTRR